MCWCVGITLQFHHQVGRGGVLCHCVECLLVSSYTSTMATETELIIELELKAVTFTEITAAHKREKLSVEMCVRPLDRSEGG